MKRALVGALVVFLALEGALATMATQSGSWDRIASVFREPLVLMMLADFSVFATIVFFWMIKDARRRGQNGWLWMPAMVLLPTAALIGFILMRPRDDGTD